MGFPVTGFPRPLTEMRWVRGSWVGCHSSIASSTYVSALRCGASCNPLCCVVVSIGAWWLAVLCVCQASVQFPVSCRARAVWEGAAGEAPCCHLGKRWVLGGFMALPLSKPHYHKAAVLVSLPGLQAPRGHGRSCHWRRVGTGKAGPVAPLPAVSLPLLGCQLSLRRMWHEGAASAHATFMSVFSFCVLWL